MQGGIEEERRISHVVFAKSKTLFLCEIPESA
jgi:hypothetical protein